MLKVDNPDGPCECLVVSCERHISRLIQVNLERQKYVVSTADDVASARTGAETGRFRLAIIFDSLPNLDGCEVLKAVRQAGSQVPIYIILISTRADSLRDGMAEYRADQYIQVPSGWGGWRR